VIVFLCKRGVRGEVSPFLFLCPLDMIADQSGWPMQENQSRYPFFGGSSLLIVPLLSREVEGTSAHSI